MLVAGLGAGYGNTSTYVNKCGRDDDTGAKLLEHNKDEVELGWQPSEQYDRPKDTCSTRVSSSILRAILGYWCVLTHSARGQNDKEKTNSKVDVVVARGGVTRSLC